MIIISVVSINLDSCFKLCCAASLGLLSSWKGIECVFNVFLLIFWFYYFIVWDLVTHFILLNANYGMKGTIPIINYQINLQIFSWNWKCWNLQVQRKFKVTFFTLRLQKQLLNCPCGETVKKGVWTWTPTAHSLLYQHPVCECSHCIVNTFHQHTKRVYIFNHEYI